MSKKIILLLASKNFRDIEYIVPRAFFEQAGFQIHTASTVPVSKGRFGFLVKHDVQIQDIKATNYDGIYLVGGGGSMEYLENENAKNIFTSFLNANKPIGAICMAPRNFLNWGFLKGKNATGWNNDGGFSKMAVEVGAIDGSEKEVVVDGLILTANGPEASEESALEFIQLLK
ncbi:MAG: DJ-1/PfpI family protein [Bacteroidetes bacterium]|nr:DJ-1/PfpI family protein [Bacteroidota bacterium]